MQGAGSNHSNGWASQAGLANLYQRKTVNGTLSEQAMLHERLRELEAERKELGKQLKK